MLRVFNGDLYLRCYRAVRETAILIPASLCERRSITLSPQLWEEIKEEHFRNHTDESISIVTAVYTTTRWAFDYRASPVEHDHYLVNVRNIQGINQIPNNFEIRSSSPSMTESYRDYNQIPYTILESHVTAVRLDLKSKRSHWKTLCLYFTLWSYSKGIGDIKIK